MCRTSFLIIGLFLITVTSLQAGFSLNPLKWFAATDEAGLDTRPTPDPIKAKEAAELLKRAKAEIESGTPGKFGRLFKKIFKKYPETEAAGEALYLHSRILMDQVQWTKAFQQLQKIIDEHPNYPNFNQVIEAQFECATALMEGTRSKTFGIVPTFKKYDKSITFFETILENGPYGEYAPLSLMNVALLAKKMKDSEQTIDALDRFVNDYSESLLLPDAYRMLAETYAGLVQSHEYDQGATRKAINYYEDFLTQFPDSENVGEVEVALEELFNTLAKSRVELGDFFHFHRNNKTAAIVFYNEAITLSPESEAASEAKKRIADIEAGVRPVRQSGILRSLLLVP